MDGDTFGLSDGREIQLVGVDAPELGECGGDAAREHARFRVEDRDVVLHAEPGVDRDRSGRPLFYVQYTGPAEADYDLGYSLAYNGLGIHYPPYAGNERYMANVREAAWRADALNLGMFTEDCDERSSPPTLEEDDDRDDHSVVAAAPLPTTRPRPQSDVRVESDPSPQPRPQPVVERAPVHESNCHPSYTPCVPVGPDLDCPDIGFEVRVSGADPHRLDADHDGRGCESYN